MRLSVARQEALQADHARLGEVADQDRPDQIDLDEAHAAQDQRPHDALAEFGLGDHQGAQPVVRHDQGLEILLGPDVDHRRLARELGQLGREIARTHFDDGRDMTQPVMAEDGDPAGQDHRHARTVLAGPCQQLAGLEMLLAAEAFDALQLGHRQRGIHLMMTGLFHRRGNGIGHAEAPLVRGHCGFPSPRPLPALDL